MEDDLNFFQMEDVLNFVLDNIGSWLLVCNIVSTQLDEIFKTKYFFLKMEDKFNFFLKIEEKLFFLNVGRPNFENGSQPQLFENGRHLIFW